MTSFRTAVASVPRVAALVAAIAFAAAAANAAHAQVPAAPPPITLEVDASHAVQGILFVHETVPAAAGPLTLVYPKWIPGEHAPNGPIANLAG